jgi:hypothetical protein
MNTNHRFQIKLVVKTAMISACSSIFLTQNLPAQSADVFEPLTGKTQLAASGDSTKVAPDVGLLKSKPSRFAIGNIELYTTAKMADFSMKKRETDIFGLIQDPEAKPPTPTSPTPGKKIRDNIAPKPLAEIIQGVKVQMVRVKDKSFLVGNRVIKEGEEFTIVFEEGRHKKLKVLKVEAKQIIFRDLDSKKNEEAALKIELLPFGMENGDNRIKPEGLVQPGENEPLSIEIN